MSVLEAEVFMLTRPENQVKREPIDLYSEFGELVRPDRTNASGAFRRDTYGFESTSIAFELPGSVQLASYSSTQIERSRHAISLVIPKQANFCHR